MGTVTTISNAERCTEVSCQSREERAENPDGIRDFVDVIMPT
jgi:hypothetical protein